MRMIFVRHAEPDYENDTLTEKGFLEAAAFSDFYKDLNVNAIYSSPLNRALLTAKAFAKNHLETKFEIIPEFREFNNEEARISKFKKENGRNSITWDFKPKDICKDKVLFDYNNYFKSDWFKNSNVETEYKKCIDVFNKILENHGYKYNDNGYFDVVKENKDTIIIFSHLGKISVLLSHLLKIPYVVLAQYFCMLPTGATFVVSEERDEKIAQFRCLKLGDTSHLSAHNLEESFMGRWAEVFSDPERH